MELWQAMERRHSVRSYEERSIDKETKEKLAAMIETCNRESGIHMQLVTEDPQAFISLMAHYGKFSGVRNYIALVGKKGTDMDEVCGYYGEKIVLYAQQLGLNTCWVAMTYKKVKGVFKVNAGEKLYVVIAIGYGKSQGVPHKSKAMELVCKADGEMPGWFQRGVEAALLAPTAMNQQKFLFTLDGKNVSARAGMGFYSKIDLGIAKYHFEIGAGAENFQWV